MTEIVIQTYDSDTGTWSDVDDVTEATLTQAQDQWAQLMFNIKDSMSNWDINKIVRLKHDGAIKFHGKIVSIQTFDYDKGIISVLCFDLLYFLSKPTNYNYVSLLHQYKIRVKSFTQTTLDCEIYNEEEDSWSDATWDTNQWQGRKFVIEPKGRTQSEYEPDSLTFSNSGYPDNYHAGSVEDVQEEPDFAETYDFIAWKTSQNRNTGLYLAIDLTFTISESASNVNALEFKGITQSRSVYYSEQWWLYNFSTSQWDLKYTVPSIDFNKVTTTLIIDDNVSNYIDTDGTVKISIVSGHNFFVTQLIVHYMHLTVHTNGDLLVPQIYEVDSNDANTLTDNSATFQSDNVAVEDEIYIMKMSGEILKDLIGNVANFDGEELSFSETWEQNDWGEWTHSGCTLDATSQITDTYSCKFNAQNDYISYEFKLNYIYKPASLSFKIKRSDDFNNIVKVYVDYIDGSQVSYDVGYTGGGSSETKDINLSGKSVIKVKFVAETSGATPFYIDDISLQGTETAYEGSQPMIIESKGKSVLDVLKQIASIEGCHFWVEDNYLHYKKTFESYGTVNTQYVSNFKQIKDASELCNHIRVIGYQYVSAVASDSTSISNYGLYERTVYIPEFRTEKECQDYADEYISNHKDIHNTCTFVSTLDIPLMNEITLSLTGATYRVENKKSFFKIGKDVKILYEYGCGYDPISFDPLTALTYQHRELKSEITNIKHRQLDIDTRVGSGLGMVAHANEWHTTAFAASSDLTSHTGDNTIHFVESSIDHTNIQNVGTKTHAQIDSHIVDSSIHFSESSIDHNNIQNIGSNSHVQIDSHISSNSNPHSVSLDQAFDAGKEIDGADSESNALVIGNGGAGKFYIYTEAGTLLKNTITTRYEAMQIMANAKADSGLHVLDTTRTAAIFSLYTSTTDYNGFFEFITKTKTDSASKYLRIYPKSTTVQMLSNADINIETPETSYNTYFKTGYRWYWYRKDAGSEYLRMYLTEVGNLSIDGDYYTFTPPLPEVLAVPLICKISNTENGELDKSSLPADLKTDLEIDLPDGSKTTQTAFNNSKMLMYLVKAVQELAEKVEKLESLLK